jgi:hypothetical protein
MLPPPGTYRVDKLTAIRLTVNPDGSALLEGLRVVVHKPKPNNLLDIWKKDAPFTLEKLRSELSRIGVLHNNNYLKLSGKGVRSLYRFLEKCGVVEAEMDMTDVYRCFAGSFKLRFKGVTSLQRIMDLDYPWGDNLALLRPDSNAISDSDTIKVNNEI